MARYSVDYDGDLSTTDDRVSYNSFDAATGAISDQGFNSYSIQDNRRGGGGNLGSFGSDEAGRRAGFGALNDARSVGGFGLLGGLLGNRPFGVIGADGARTGVLADMFNGGGRGASGNAFQGGLLSSILNALGVLPAGFRSRQEAEQPQPQMSQADVLAQMAAPPVMASQPVSAPVMPAPVVPMDSPRGRRAPMSASPDYLGPRPSTQTASYTPIGMEGPMRDLAMPSIHSLPSATRRYYTQFGVPTPSSASFIQNPQLPQRAAPSMSDLEQYVLSNSPAPRPAGGFNAPQSAYERIMGIGQYGILGR